MTDDIDFKDRPLEIFETLCQELRNNKNRLTALPETPLAYSHKPRPVL